MAIPESDIQVNTFDTLRRAISPVSVWQFLLYVSIWSAHSCPEDIQFDGPQRKPFKRCQTREQAKNFYMQCDASKWHNEANIFVSRRQSDVSYG